MWRFDPRAGKFQQVLHNHRGEGSGVKRSLNGTREKESDSIFRARRQYITITIPNDVSEHKQLIKLWLNVGSAS